MNELYGPATTAAKLPGPRHATMMDCVRPIRKILALVAICVAAVLGFLLTPRMEQTKALVGAAWVEERQTDPRPSHVEAPIPGTFGELVEPHLAELHESLAAYKHVDDEERARARAIYQGEAPIGRLGRETAANLALHRRALLGVLRATHAAGARAPGSLRMFAALRPGDPFLDLQHAARLAALDVLTLVEEGHLDEAAEECSDALALGRDVSYSSALGRMVGVAMTDIVASACARSLPLADVDVLRKVHDRLVRIRAATPRFMLILERESLFFQLSLIEPDARLPESARIAVADIAALRTTSWARLRNRLFRETAWGPLHARMNAYMDAQRLDWPACIATMERTANAGLEWNPLVGDDQGFSGILRKHREGLSKLDAVICVASVSLARARSGALPGDIASVCPPPEPLATCGETSVPFRLVTDGSSARLTWMLSPDGTESSLPVKSAVAVRR